MEYSGNKLINNNNGAFIILVVIFGYVALFAGKTSDKNIGLIMLFLAFLIVAVEAFYFELTDDELIVKNYMLPFLNIHYALSDITRIELAGTNFRSTAAARLKITRGNKTSFGFKGGALAMSDWQSLVIDLSGRKIPVAISASRLAGKIGIPED